MLTVYMFRWSANLLINNDKVIQPNINELLILPCKSTRNASGRNASGNFCLPTGTPPGCSRRYQQAQQEMLPDSVAPWIHYIFLQMKNIVKFADITCMCTSQSVQ